MQHCTPQAGKRHPCLASLHPPGAQKKSMVLCTSLSRSPGRCLPYSQLWDFSAASPKVLSWLAKPCHPTEHGISPRLLNAHRLWPSQVELECDFAQESALAPRSWLFKGPHWCRAPAPRIHSQHSFSWVFFRAVWGCNK